MKKETAYFVANSFTMARAGLGLGSVMAAASGDSTTAIGAWLAGLPTELDGTIADKFRVNTPRGAFRDRLADIIFFPSPILSYGLALIQDGRVKDGRALISIGLIYIGGLVFDTLKTLKSDRRYLEDSRNPSL